MKQPVAAALLVVAASGCASVGPAGPIGAEAPRERLVHCARNASPAPAVTAAAEPATRPDPDRETLARLPFSARALETARIIGVLPELVHFRPPAPASASASPEPGTTQDLRARIDDLLVRQQVLARIALASLEVSSVLAELDCEGERNDQLRDRLQRVQDNRLRRLTLSGLVVGAATAISGGVLAMTSSGNAANVAAILGGTAETGIGLSALGDTQVARLDHPRNLLGEIWDGETRASGLFPASVWMYLNAPSSRAGNVTNRELLLEQWRSPERLGPPQAPETEARVALLFGAGGVYSLGDLQVRDAMLDMLEARVALFNQNIADLLREVIASSAPAR
jgi:hypothetical protein